MPGALRCWSQHAWKAYLRLRLRAASLAESRRNRWESPREESRAIRLSMPLSVEIWLELQYKDVPTLKPGGRFRARPQGAHAGTVFAQKRL